MKYNPNPPIYVDEAYPELIQFFENKDSNGKLINPFDRTQDGLYEAKHQCMLNNGVIILKVEDIKRLN